MNWSSTVYIAFSEALEIEQPQFLDIHCNWVQSASHPARVVLEAEHVYSITPDGEIGSNGLSDLETVGMKSRKNPLHHLRNFLLQRERQIEEIVTLSPNSPDSEHPETRDSISRMILDADSLLDPNFTFATNVIYNLWPSHVPGPYRLSDFWPPVRLMESDIGGCNPELSDYIRDFSGKTWPEVTGDLYDTHTDVFCLMDAKTLRHLLPGYLNKGALDMKSIENWPLLISAASPGFIEHLRELTTAQLAYTVQVLDFMMRAAEGDFFEEWQHFLNTSELQLLLSVSPSTCSLPVRSRFFKTNSLFQKTN